MWLAWERQPIENELPCSFCFLSESGYWSNTNMASFSASSAKSPHSSTRITRNTSFVSGYFVISMAFFSCAFAPLMQMPFARDMMPFAIVCNDGLTPICRVKASSIPIADVAFLLIGATLLHLFVVLSEAGSRKGGNKRSAPRCRSRTDTNRGIKRKASHRIPREAVGLPLWKHEERRVRIRTSPARCRS